MDRSEYDKLDRVEDRMWWFAALHDNLMMIARRLPLDAIELPILDAGCGTGGFLARLAGSYRERALVGLDFDIQASKRAAMKSAQPVCAGSVNHLPFADGVLAAIFSADVLCHEGVDECRALRQFHRCLAENGWLILNLPAYRWMLSRHDVAVRNVRRYTVTGVRRLLQSAGFYPVYLSYWNALLFPIMAITRKLFPGDRATSDVELYPRPLDLLCRAATTIESALLRAGAKFPYGGSVLAVAARGKTDG